MPHASFSRWLLLAVVGVSLLGTPGLAAFGLATAARNPARSDYPASIRRPRGIYAVVVIDESRGKGSEDLDALTSNPAVSGLAIRMFWSSLQPAKDRYDFSKLDAAFASVAAKHKTIQLILVPGFGTPAWVLDEIPPCDGSAMPSASGGDRAGRGGRAGRAGRGGRADGGGSGNSPADASQCGKTSFEVSEGVFRGQKQELPMPWNPVYKRYWKAFLTEVEARFGARPEFVSIAIAGPTAESVEIILPRAGDQLERWAQLLQLSYRDASYHRTDKAFVDEWDAAVTVYGEVFRNVTLIVTRGSGLLNFSPGQGKAAQTAIVSAFANHAVGPNAKATQTSGMKACRATLAGIKGVKEMSADSSISPPVLGGAQFDTSVSARPAVEGCSASCDAEVPACQKVTPGEALANVLSVYFEGTTVGDLYGAPKGDAPMNYLQVYASDIKFANTQSAFQAILEQASQRILKQAK
jgi:hypothetical protein